MIAVQVIEINTSLFGVGVPRADLKHYEDITDAAGELNRTMMEGRIEYGHSIKAWMRWDDGHVA